MMVFCRLQVTFSFPSVSGLLPTIFVYKTSVNSPFLKNANRVVLSLVIQAINMSDNKEAFSILFNRKVTALSAYCSTYRHKNVLQYVDNLEMKRKMSINF